MAIRICDCCGKPIADEADVCPHCGAEQQEDIRLNKIPETIEELRTFCAAHKMPLDTMRFFIGEDFKGARAFGIFKREDETCVVYKNKSDGSRVVRYEGPDEKRAVREIYEKLKSETQLRREAREYSAPARGAVGAENSSRAGGRSPRGRTNALGKLAGFVVKYWQGILIAAFAAAALRGVLAPDSGYYRYRDDTYYYYNYHWYLYDTQADDWERAYSVPEELKRDHDDYYESEDYDSAYSVPDFTYSSCYDDDDSLFNSDSSYDDYDWDGGYDDYSSWDSSDTDWDSDW